MDDVTTQLERLILDRSLLCSETHDNNQKLHLVWYASRSGLRNKGRA